MTRFSIEIPPRRGRRIPQSRGGSTRIRLPVEIIDHIVGYLENEGVGDRLVIGGRLSLASKQLFEYGRRVIWNYTAIVCTDRNRRFATELAARRDLLSHVRSLVFQLQAADQSSAGWVSHMLAILKGCSCALKILNCGLQFGLLDRSGQSLAFRHVKDLIELARLPMAATLESLGLHVVLGTNIDVSRSDIGVVELGSALDAFVKLEYLHIQSTWAAPLPAGQVVVTGKRRFEALYFNDQGMGGQPSLAHLLSPCIDPSETKHLWINVGLSQFGGPDLLTNFVNLKSVHLNAKPGARFTAALPEWVAGLSHLEHLQTVHLGPKEPVAGLQTTLSPSTVALDVLLASLPPSIKTYKVEQVYFVNNLALDFFPHREYLLYDHGLGDIDLSKSVVVRLADRDYDRLRFELGRMSGPGGTTLWGIYRALKEL
ncbi:hypothetical protein JCM3775_002671 [Rhodotorula graminis]